MKKRKLRPCRFCEIAFRELIAAQGKSLVTLRNPRSKFIKILWEKIQPAT